jgi:Ca2+-transporting ATPase
MRVLAVAEAQAAASGPLPTTPRDFAFVLLGVAGLADPLRPTVPAAIRECRSAGIRVAMITGDHPVTARAIARQAGIDADEVLDGPTIERMNDAELQTAVQHTSIFARITPIQKLRIVTALKAHGEVVAMTGDGVNDAPSLKAADIGIAMGGRGTDVAREAASLVLLDDDFGSIVRTIRLGRRIYDNLRKAMAFIIAVHVPIAGLSLIPLFAGMPLIFAPIHIAFLEMVIDPVCSMVFEAERAEPDIMERPPRATTSTLFSPVLIGWSLVQGIIVLMLLVAIYWLAPHWDLSEADARALVFVSLVLVDLGLVLVNRSFGTSLVLEAGRENHVLWWVSGVTLALLASTVSIPVVRSLFQFGLLHIDDLIVIVTIVTATLLVLESLKRFWRKYLIS